MLLQVRVVRREQRHLGEPRTAVQDEQQRIAGVGASYQDRLCKSAEQHSLPQLHAFAHGVPHYRPFMLPKASTLTGCPQARLIVDNGIR
jgi:hypothetical protein